VKKKMWANSQRIIELSTQKLSLSSQKYGFGIRDQEKIYSGSRIQDPGVKKAPDPGSRSATLFLRLKIMCLWVRYKKKYEKFLYP
jgi:hypothetical protein